MKLLSVDEAVKILGAGGAIAVPTETVYGLAAVADNKDAIGRIFQIKNRPADNPLICHFHLFQQAKEYLLPYPAYVKTLMETFSPGPVSYLLKQKSDSPLKAATVGSDDLIIRIPAHPMLLEVLRKLNKPIAAPSANTSGRYSATNAAMVDADLGNKIDGIIDGGDCLTGIESTILDCRDNHVINILRPGVIGAEEIKEVLRDKFNYVEVKEDESTITTPGAKYKHYAPATPLKLIVDFSEIDIERKPVLITVDELLADAKQYLRDVSILSLGSVMKPETIAKNLYRKMFEMDMLKADIAYILIHEIKNETWRNAIMNRVGKMVS